MKASEFRKKIIELGYITSDYENGISVLTKSGDIEIALIDCYRPKHCWMEISSTLIDVAKLVLEYAETPLDEREYKKGKEKKYYVVLPDPENVSNVRPTLSRRKDGRITITQEHASGAKVYEHCHLTKSEIRRNHAYLWEFRKEVINEEVEEE